MVPLNFAGCFFAGLFDLKMYPGGFMTLERNPANKLVGIKVGISRF